LNTREEDTMTIDDNALEKEALERMNKGDESEGMRLQWKFLEDVKKSGQDHCSCTNKGCPYHGKCMECVVIHRGHRDHLPSCFDSMVAAKKTSAI
jgi:hypothetical protein